jgi:hypothetical protein
VSTGEFISRRLMLRVAGQPDAICGVTSETGAAPRDLTKANSLLAYCATGVLLKLYDSGVFASAPITIGSLVLCLNGCNPEVIQIETWESVPGTVQLAFARQDAKEQRRERWCVTPVG